MPKKIGRILEMKTTNGNIKWNVINRYKLKSVFMTHIRVVKSVNGGGEVTVSYLFL